jgi:hypothetical protein
VNKKQGQSPRGEGKLSLGGRGRHLCRGDLNDRGASRLAGGGEWRAHVRLQESSGDVRKGPAQSPAHLPPHRPPHLPPELRLRLSSRRLKTPGREAEGAAPGPRPRSPRGVFPPAVAKVIVTSRGRGVQNVWAAAAVAGKRPAGALPGAGLALRLRTPGRAVLASP